MKAIIGEKLLNKKIIAEYDTGKLEDYYAETEKSNYKTASEKLFQQGIILHNIHFVHFMNKKKNDAKEYGIRAEEKYNMVLADNPGSLDAITFRCLLYQTLSTIDWQCGAQFGPKIMKEVQNLKNEDQNNFFIRVINAYTFLKTPKIFGGNLKKALEALVNLKMDFPDNEDIKVFLAKAFYKEKKYEMAKKEIQDVLADNPRNLFAQKINEMIDKKIANIM